MTSGGPKIVQIETRYIETDAINFKDVVQSLTGKNSSTAWIGKGGFVAGTITKQGTEHDDGVSASKTKKGANTSDGTNKKNSVTSSMALLKNMSFKDFDGLLSDLPSLEELLWL
ncbi:hypothetical protein RIF29_13752 [Crotalaria pallida]|uniref:VQ domain-containing protein n=1 Tax=Crotalaria pallida TaxID=3830 RepID=A0AAN9P3C8_CROPI